MSRLGIESSRLAACIGFVVAILNAQAPLAHADNSTVRAKQLYEDGLTNYNLGHYEEALTAFDGGYRIRHDPAFLFNIAQCQRQLHRYEDAERSYRAYVRESADLPQATRDQVQKLVTEMQSAIAEQRPKTQSPGTPAATTIARAQLPAPPPAVTTAAATPARRWYKNPAGMALVVGGIVVACIGGGLLGIGVKDEHDASNASTLSSQRTLDASAHTLQPTGIALLAVGGGSLAVGTILLAVDARRHAETNR